MTIKFYVDKNKYMGWQYINKTNYLEVEGWLLSGNSIVINNATYRNIKDIPTHFLKLCK